MTSNTAAESRALLRTARLACIIVALVLGVVYAWRSEHQVGPDGIVYLDLADASLRSDVRQAVNTLWSPLYPLLLAPAFRIVTPYRCLRG